MKELISGIFSRHHEYYKSLGVETIKQQMSQYRHVEEAYQGRFIFELLQNAIDRADHRVYVKLFDSGNLKGHLIVANDGKPFTFSADYNYRDGGNKRCDFQSLCSIATSTKIQSKNIGNKGVGFKSVYSVCRYANIYCKGAIYVENKEFHEVINFRLYDFFDDPKDLPLPELALTLERVKQENPNWGIPGYYFPQMLDETPAEIAELLSKGYVTVIDIPLLSEGSVAIARERINQFQDFHFFFIRCLEDFKNRTIHINFDDRFEHKVEPSSLVFSRKISARACELAEKAGLAIDENSEVAIYLRPNPDGKGKLYNFLPTECDSPFPNIDIHADFQTSVDRKNIVRDPSTPIGAYNAQLLREAYQIIRSIFIGETEFEAEIFSPEHLQVRNFDVALLRDVFYKTYEEDGLKILRKWIMPKSSANNYDVYYSSICALLANCRYYGDNYSPYEDKAAKLGQKLSGERFLPDTPCRSKRIFYRPKSSSSISLPDSINAEITSYALPYAYRLSDALRRGMEVKMLEETNQIYSLLWQCSPDGVNISEDSIAEEEQIQILRSVAQLIEIERNRAENDSPTWRFASINDSKDPSDKTRAAFALSTLFYRTKSGLYRPGQTLRKDEIDSEFLTKLNLTDEQLTLLLNKTGVSRSSKYKYADCRMMENISGGMDRIPALMPAAPRVSRSEAWANIRIFYDDKAIQPALVNENYSFFENIPRNENNKRSFNDLRIANYEQFPTAYIEHLRQKHYVNRQELRKFYTKFAKPLFDKDFVLILKSGKVEVSHGSSTFYVIDNPALLSENNPPIDFPILLTTALEGFDRQVSEIRIKNDAEDYHFDPEYLQYLSPERIESKLREGEVPDNLHEKANAVNTFNLRFFTRIVCDCKIGDLFTIEIDSIPYLIDKETINIRIDPDNDSLNRKLIARAYSSALFGSEKFSDALELIICGTDIEPFRHTGEYHPQDDTPPSPSDSAMNEPEVAEINLSLYDIQTIDLKGVTAQTQKINTSPFSTGNGHGPHISPKSILTGYQGEKAVSQLIARQFLAEFPSEQEQVAAINIINQFLTIHNFNPITFKPTDIASSLWYTKGGTLPFDIITYSSGQVRLIEVKTTNGNNILRLSKREMKIAAQFPDNYLIYRLDSSTRKLDIIQNLIRPEFTEYTLQRYKVVPSGLEIEIV